MSTMMRARGASIRYCITGGSFLMFMRKSAATRLFIIAMTPIAMSTEKVPGAE